MEDHVITGTTLYPGAGMLIMALEAALQLADTTKVLRGVEFRDVTFDKGMVIPSADQSLEVSLSVRPHASTKSRYEYAVFSISAGDTWIKHSWGQFTILYKKRPSQVETTAQSDREISAFSHEYQDIKRQATWPINVETF